MSHALLLIIFQLIIFVQVKMILYELEQLSFGIVIHDNVEHSHVDRFMSQ